MGQCQCKQLRDLKLTHIIHEHPMPCVEVSLHPSPAHKPKRGCLCVHGNMNLHYNTPRSAKLEAYALQTSLYFSEAKAFVSGNSWDRMLHLCQEQVS